MLGIIGFGAATIAIIFFVYSFRKSYPQIDTATKHHITVSFSILALVMGLCGLMLASFDESSDLKPVLLAIDSLMLVGTAFMISIILPLRRAYIIVLLALTGSLLLALRAYEFQPAAYIDSGVLFFNLEGAPRYILLGAILGVWYPAAHIAAMRAVRSLRLPQFNSLMTLGYFMLAATTAIFFSTRDREMIIISFGGLVLTFACIASANLMVKKYALITKKGQKHGK